MEGVRFRVITANDPDIFQERLNRFIEELAEDTVLVDVKFTTSAQGNQALYTALVQYKIVETWKD
ncbi:MULTISPECIES: hypothetical protein [unclassified Meiothermus]|uniref:hypothetical protein n=1 Tax=unclassified Meiothermus TaxID=370471 RepID=UPI000D7CDE7A|nr:MULTISPECIES: hypothetical protein [unclassified Meiothermus]PZA05873.1 hypothetical protein DNA98_16475 [Meiothermus sp. Pnk-1]RYM30731.1 hypothetical protein EWH23_15155 [Meiothermus sp. PNK-Is4]